MTLPGETDATVAAYRVPLNENRAYGLARVLSEYPEHELRIVEQFLLVDAVGAPADPMCNERGVPESECPPHCRHDRVGTGA